MKRLFQVAALLCALCAPCFGEIIFFLDAPQDDAKARQGIRTRSELQPLRDDYDNLIHTRIWTLNSSEVATIFGPPVSTRGSSFGGDTNPPAQSGGSTRGPRPDDMVLPLFAPSMSMISGLHSPDPSMNHDHTDLQAIGSLGYLEFFYGNDGTHIQQAVLYLRADKGFVPLQSDSDFAKRLEWDTNRFAAVKNWLEARLPKLTDFGVVQIPEVSPLPEPVRGPGAGHQFQYATTVPVWVQGAVMAFNIAGKEQPFPESKFTNHWIEVRIAAASPDAPQRNDPPVFSTAVTPDKPVAFSVDGKVFSLTPKIINVGAHPVGSSSAPGPIMR